MSLLDDAWGLVKKAVNHVNPFSWFDYVDALTGKADVESQHEANEYNLHSVQDTNATNLAISREANQKAYQMWQEQRDDNRKYFEDTMAYNSADAQVDRLAQAGLNPALAMYQGVDGGTVSASSSPAPPAQSVPTMQAPHISPIDYSSMRAAAQNAIAMVTAGANAVTAINTAKHSGRVAAANASSAESQAVSNAAGAYVADNSKEADVKGRKSEAHSKSIKASVDDATEQTAIDTINQGLENMQAQGEILNQDATIKSYEATLASLRHSALANLDRKDAGKLMSLLENKVISELEDAVLNRQIHGEQLRGLVHDVTIKKLEADKAIFTKEGYETINNALKHSDSGLLKSILSVLFTYATELSR